MLKQHAQKNVNINPSYRYLVKTNINNQEVKPKKLVIGRLCKPLSAVMII